MPVPKPIWDEILKDFSKMNHNNNRFIDIVDFLIKIWQQLMF